MNNTRVAIDALPAFVRMQRTVAVLCLVSGVLMLAVPTHSDVALALRRFTGPLMVLSAVLLWVTYRRFSRNPAIEVGGGRITFRKGPFITITRQTEGPIEAAPHGRSPRLSWSGGSRVIDGRMVSQQALLAALTPQG